MPKALHLCKGAEYVKIIFSDKYRHLYAYSEKSPIILLTIFSVQKSLGSFWKSSPFIKNAFFISCTNKVAQIRTIVFWASPDVTMIEWLYTSASGGFFFPRSFVVLCHLNSARQWLCCAQKMVCYVLRSVCVGQFCWNDLPTMFCVIGISINTNSRQTNFSYRKSMRYFCRWKTSVGCFPSLDCLLDFCAFYGLI